MAVAAAEVLGWRGDRPARSRLRGRTALCGALTLCARAGIRPQRARGRAAGHGGCRRRGGHQPERYAHGDHAAFADGAAEPPLLRHRRERIREFRPALASALAVNRVVGSDLPTSIAGKLTANGNVWVLNPSGVAIKGTAQVNVGGLLATTASISDEDIIAGKRSFAGAPAGSAVTNAGTIEAGQGGVVLVAPVVSNTGSITDERLGRGARRRIGLYRRFRRGRADALRGHAGPRRQPDEYRRDLGAGRRRLHRRRVRRRRAEIGRLDRRPRRGDAPREPRRRHLHIGRRRPA